MAASCGNPSAGLVDGRHGSTEMDCHAVPATFGNEMLDECAVALRDPPLLTLSPGSLQAQMPLLISDYFMQMAERVYGDAAATDASAAPPRWHVGFSGATDGTPRATSTT